MKNKLIIFSLVFMCSLILAYANCHNSRNIVLEIQQTDYGKAFLLKNSKINLENIINFIEDPENFFEVMKKIDKPCSYIAIYERFSYGRFNNQSVFTIFLKNHFKELDDKKAHILTFMLLKCDSPVYIEEIADKYTKLFRIYYKNILNSLKNTDWKLVVDRLDAGNWEEFEMGLNRLGDSEFERVFKSYVLAPRDDNGNRINK